MQRCKTSLQYLISEKISTNIYKNIGLLTHAYCLSRTGMNKILKKIEILNLPDDEVPHLDMFYYDILLNENCYIIAPMLFDQRWCLESNNIPFNFIEKILRKGQCLFTITNITYVLSLILIYREWVIFLIIIVFVLLNTKIIGV